MTVPTPGPPISRPPCESTEKAVDGSVVHCVGHLGHPAPHSDGRALRWTDRYVEVDTPEEPTVAAYRVSTRRAALLDAIAQASITIQRSVAELEQMPELDHVVDQGVCGTVAELDGGTHAVCARPAGHEGKHASPLARWSDPLPAEQRYCGHVAQATGVEVKCELEADHGGRHQRGELSWLNTDAPSADLNPEASVCGQEHPRANVVTCTLPAGHALPHCQEQLGAFWPTGGVNLGPSHRR